MDSQFESDIEQQHTVESKLLKCKDEEKYKITIIILIILNLCIFLMFAVELDLVNQLSLALSAAKKKTVIGLDAEEFFN